MLQYFTEMAFFFFRNSISVCFVLWWTTLRLVNIGSNISYILLLHLMACYDITPLTLLNSTGPLFFCEFWSLLQWNATVVFLMKIYRKCCVDLLLWDGFHLFFIHVVVFSSFLSVSGFWAFYIIIPLVWNSLPPGIQHNTSAWIFSPLSPKFVIFISNFL